MNEDDRKLAYIDGELRKDRDPADLRMLTERRAAIVKGGARHAAQKKMRL